MPAVAGVGQLLGPAGTSLIIGMPSNLRRWAATHLGRGKPSKKTGRPPIDLRPVAGSLRFRVTTSGFDQRLAFERLMAGSVPLAARRDLKKPAYLRLDATDRFPALTLATSGAPDAAPLFGPFRDRRAAALARDAVNKRFLLRPCDYVFEPDPELPLGKACVFAQVRSCAAPCLARVGETEYRELARQAQGFLAEPSRREPDALLPAWVTGLDALALVVEKAGEEYELHPIRRGRVLDASQRRAPDAELEAALAGIEWNVSGTAPDDAPWLVAWLREPRRRGGYFVLSGSDSRAASSLSSSIRSAFAPAARGSKAAS